MYFISLAPSENIMFLHIMLGGDDKETHVVKKVVETGQKVKLRGDGHFK